jgi:hypothetical protein
MNDQIEDLAKQIANMVRPAVPIEVALWDYSDIGGYMRRSPQVVRERIACQPGFPKPIKIPSIRNGEAAIGQPLFKAIEVIAWTESHRAIVDKGRPRKAG